MPAKRPPNKEQVIDREAKAWAMRCKGWTLRRIAGALEISHEGVRQILKRVQARELKALTQDFENMKVEHDALLDTAIEEAFEGWFKSKEPRRSVRQTTDADGKEVTVTEAIEREGNIAYLDRVFAGLDRKRKLWGLDVAEAQQETSFSVSEMTAAAMERDAKHDAERAAESSQDRLDKGDAASPGDLGQVQDGPK